MLQEKRTSVAAAANKLRNGLFKIDDTKEKVQVMRVELEEAQVKGILSFLFLLLFQYINAHN